MSLAVLARKSKATNPRYNNNKGCFSLAMSRRGKFQNCIGNGFDRNCGSCKSQNIPSIPILQSSYHNFQRKIKKQNCKNCCFMGSNQGGRVKNTTKIWNDLSKNCIPEIYEKSSDIILKKKNNALNYFINENQNFSNVTIRNDGKCIYYKEKTCCNNKYNFCYNGKRIKDRIYSNKIAFTKEENKWVKSLSEIENLKKPQSDYLAKLKAKTLNNFKKKFCCDMKEKNYNIYLTQYSTICNNIETGCENNI